MKLLKLLFGKEDVAVPLSTDSKKRAQEVILGTDEKSEEVHQKANRVQTEYLEARKQAIIIKEASKKIIKHLDTLSAVAIATGGRSRGFKL